MARVRIWCNYREDCSVYQDNKCQYNGFYLLDNGRIMCDAWSRMEYERMKELIRQGNKICNKVADKSAFKERR